MMLMTMSMDGDDDMMNRTECDHEKHITYFRAWYFSISAEALSSCLVLFMTMIHKNLRSADIRYETIICILFHLTISEPRGISSSIKSRWRYKTCRLGFICIHALFYMYFYTHHSVSFFLLWVLHAHLFF